MSLFSKWKKCISWWNSPRRRRHHDPSPTAPLESRVLLASVSAAEQLFLELVNRARANPTNEARRLGINLNEGLPAGTITSGARQPLALNDALQNSIEGHLQDMISNDFFSHRGSDGSSLTDRITDAGYEEFTIAGENLAYLPFDRNNTLEQQIHNIYRAMFVDKDVRGRGHRVDMLIAAFKEAGSGVATGNFKGTQSLFVGHDFGAQAGESFLTGVAYSDAVKVDNFYSIGEGLGGVTVTVRDGSRVVGTTTTNSAGGYDIQLPAGRYTVTFSGRGLRQSVSKTVSISNVNVKVDVNAKRDVVTLPTVQFSASTFSASESARTKAITVTLSKAATTQVLVNYSVSNGTARSGRDFTAVSGSLLFAAGERTKTINVEIREDALDEPNETVNLRLSSPVGLLLGTRVAAVLTIVDNDPTPSASRSGTAGSGTPSNGQLLSSLLDESLLD